MFRFYEASIFFNAFALKVGLCRSHRNNNFLTFEKKIIVQQIKIHKAFNLDGNIFETTEKLLDFVRDNTPEHYNFLLDLFDKKDYIIAKTSGSTGKPKEIKILKKYLINSAKKTIDFFNLQPNTSALLNLSSDFIAGKMMWVRAIIGGWQLDVVSPENKAIKKKLQQNNYDFGAMVPLQVDANIENIHKIEKLIIGGGVVSENLQNKIYNLPNEIFATYGMTETVTHIAVKPLNKKAIYNFYSTTDFIGFYRVLPQIKIDCDKRNCLVITATCISENPVITNDIVEIKDEKHFRWLGRYDNIINSGGIKLMPEEIEKKLAPHIKQKFFIASIPDEKLGEKVILVVEGNNIPTIDFTSVLKKYEIPRLIFKTDKMKLTSTGKINRKKILEKLSLP